MQRFTVTPLIGGTLDAAILIDGAMAGGLQEILPDGKTLRIVQSRGLPPSFIDAIREIDLWCSTTCAQACSLPSRRSRPLDAVIANLEVSVSELHEARLRKLLPA